jgi:hypothetical protein
MHRTGAVSVSRSRRPCRLPWEGAGACGEVGSFVHREGGGHCDRVASETQRLCAADQAGSGSYTVYWTDGKAMMKGAGMGERLLGAMGDKDTQKALKKVAGDGGDLKGLGDAASFQIVMLHVLKGDVYLSFDARMCSRAQAIELARKAVARL